MRAGQLQEGDQQVEDMKSKQEQAEAQEMQRRMVLRQILTPEASERLCRIGLVKKEKQDAVENMLLQAMQRGGLGGKIDESTVIDLLGKYEASVEKKTSVSIQRKDMFDDDDDLGLDDL